MAYKLEVNHPDFDKGFEFDCDGILVKNGESVTLTKEDEIAFLARWGKDVKHFYGHGEIAKVTGSSTLSAKELQDARGNADEEEEETTTTDEKTDGGDS